MTRTPDAPRADIAVIGGTGFYSLFGPGSGASEVQVPTPYGEHARGLTVGEIAGRSVAFLPRHGVDHHDAPHSIPYRANLWALRSLGVRQVLAPCAVGGLRDVAPGDLVVPDQLVDRTSGRVQTFADGPGVTHVPFADPYCARLSGVLAEADPDVHRGGTMVVIEGPRFSTRAESQWYAAQGWTLINMTGHPEAVLARELRMCYSSLALVTDMDAGLEAGEGVDEEQVLALFRANLDRLTGLLTATIGGLAALPDPATCTCSTWAEGLHVAWDIP